MLAGHAPLMAARAELAQAEAQHDEMLLAHAHATLAELNEGAISASAMAVMHGLGFADLRSRAAGVGVFRAAGAIGWHWRAR